MNFYAINVAPINGDAGQIHYGESSASLALQAEASLIQATTGSITANALLSAKADSGRAIYENGSALLSLLSKNLTHYVRNYNQGKAGLLLNTSGKSSDVYFGFGVCSLSLNSKKTSHYVNSKGSGKSTLSINASAKSGLALLSKANAELTLNSLNLKHYVKTYGTTEAFMFIMALGNYGNLVFGNGRANQLLNANNPKPLIYQYAKALSNLKLDLKAESSLRHNGSGLSKLELNGKASYLNALTGKGVADNTLKSKAVNYVKIPFSGIANTYLRASSKEQLAITSKGKSDFILLAKANGERAHFEYGLAELRLISRAAGKAVIYLKGKSNIVLGAFNLSSIIAPTSKGLSELELKSIGNENVIFKPSARSNLELKAIGQYSNSILGHAISELQLTSIGNAVIATIGDAAPSRINMLSSATGKVHIYLFGKSSLKMLSNAHLSIILYEHGLVEISLNAKSSGKIAMLGSVESLFELMAKDGIPNPPIAPIWFNDAHRSARLKEPTENRSFVVPKDRGKMTVTDNQSIRIQRE